MPGGDNKVNTFNQVSTGELVFYVCLILVFIIMAVHYLKANKPVKASVAGMLSGAVTLIAVHFWGGYIGLHIPLNLFTTVISLVLGVPAVIIIALILLFF